MSKAINELHTPVALEYAIEMLGPALTGTSPVLVDGTLGLGGHTEAFLERFENLTVVGIDRDEKALELASTRLARFGARFIPAHAIYSEILEVLEAEGIESVEGILLDLGVSSMQLDEADRGFAYSFDAPLDMRMNQTEGITAADVIATYSEHELRNIFHKYGDEKLSARYAKAIVTNREIEPITRSGQLVHILTVATPAALSHSGHPAKRVFQALRIEVNQELSVLETAIPAALGKLALGGRIVVMSYQSLEDRIVKGFLQAGAASSAPVGLPVELEQFKPELKLLVRGAELASDEEKARNPRATPVRLRAAERIKVAA